VAALPNMRVQRTRVLLAAVARRSPLTRGPLGGPGSLDVITSKRYVSCLWTSQNELPSTLMPKCTKR
jgi:hypothetical protein